MRQGGRISLDPRLSMIASLVGQCQCCADTGCDHGRLGAFLLQSGQCGRVILSDISEPSLKKARVLIGNLGLIERAAFCVADGIPQTDDAPDVIVIAGMGGATIADILRKDRHRLGRARLILQPNVAAPLLRGALCEIGYAISQERVVRDGRRCYVIMTAEPGKADYGLKERVVGPVLLRTLPPELTDYARFRLRVTEKALKGADQGDDEAQRRALTEELEIWREVLSCLQR